MVSRGKIIIRGFCLFAETLILLVGFNWSFQFSLQNRRVFDDKLNGIMIHKFSLVLQNTNLNHSGEYTCTADNKVGKRTSNTRSLDIERKDSLQMNYKY